MCKSAPSWLRLQSPVVLDDQVIFCLTVSLDKLPVDTLRAKVRNPLDKKVVLPPPPRPHSHLPALRL